MFHQRLAGRKAQDDLILVLRFIRNIPEKLQSIQMGKSMPGCCTCSKSHPLVAKHHVMVDGQEGACCCHEKNGNATSREKKYFWGPL